MKLTGPIFYSNDLTKAVNFYEALGLTVLSHEENAYAQLQFPNKANELGIKAQTGGREKPGSQTMLITSEDIEETYDLAQKIGATIAQELKEVSWGKRFILEDPDGNWVEFIQG